jgi:hypothetical protein
MKISYSGMTKTEERESLKIILGQAFHGETAKPLATIATNPNPTTMSKHTYGFKIINGRVKIYVNGYVMFTFNQIDFKGYYSYKDDTLLYGIDIYLMNEKGGATTMEIYFKTKENWLGILRLLDENL